MNLEDTVTPYSLLSKSQKLELLEKRRKERFKSKRSTKPKSIKEKVFEKIKLEKSVANFTVKEAKEALARLEGKIVLKELK